MNNFFEKLFSPLISMKLITNKWNPVLLYHSLGKTSKFNKIDHVNLETLNSQLSFIKKYWKFVSIDEYANAKSKKGICKCNN